MDNIVDKIKKKLSIGNMQGNSEDEQEERKKREQQFISTLEKMDTDSMLTSDEISKMTESTSVPTKSNMSAGKEKAEEIVRQAKAGFSVLQKQPPQEKTDDADDDLSSKQHQFWN